MSAMVNRSERLHEAYARIERKVELVGSTCVEDKLQEDVSETLQFFRSASIVVWMLTGDKRETAVNIAVSAGLILDSEDTVVHLEVKSTDPFSDPYNSETSSISSMSMSASTAAEDVGGSLPSHNLCLRRQARAQLEEQLLDAHETIKETTSLDGKAAVVLVVDGFTLGTIFEEETALEKFFDISCRCRSAICCRMTPAQKAEVVRMFKKHTKQVTLAIGDGANDVPMIQASSIGIGIMGLEGSQAELCSDYAIPKFRFLKRLLMVHGRYSLYRDAHCILYSIYKNVFITVGMIGYSFYCGFSGQTFIDSWYLALFSVAFCAIQPMLVGILDKDVSEELAESVPQLYPPLSREKMYFSAPYIFKWLSDGFIEGVFSFLVLIYFFATPENIYNGRTGCLFDYGMFFFTALVLVTNIRVSIQLAYHNLLISGVMVLMFISAPVVEILYSQFKSFAGSDTMVYVADEAYSSSMLYIYLLAAVGIFLVYTLSSHLYIQLFAPWKNARFAVLAARESPFHSVFEEKRKQLSSEYEQRLKYQEECRKKVMY